MRASAMVLLLGFLPGCKNEPSKPEATAASASTPAPTASAAAPMRDGRDLPTTATFADLIRTATALQASEKAASEPGCNLRRREDSSFRFEAGLTSEKVAAPVEDLDEILTKGEVGIRLLTQYGVMGAGGGVTLKPLSPLPKIVLTGIVPAFFVTDRGVYLRIADSFGTKLGGDKGPMPETDIDRVKEELAPKAQAIVLTAEAAVKLERIHEVLSWVKEAKGPVVLATPVDKGAVLPKTPVAAKAGLGADACPRGGLMDIPKGSKPGSYGDQSFFRVTEAYQKDALTCISSLPAESSGGKVHVEMRIEPDGKVSKTCIESDSSGEAALRKCVLERTRAYAFPRPTTEGIVNFGTELAFSPARFLTKAVCN